MSEINSGTQQVQVVKKDSFGTKLTLILVSVTLVVLGLIIAINWLPRWWAQRVGDVVDGRMSTGFIAGLGIGLIFTAIPLLMLRRVFTFGNSSITARAIWLILAALIALPNLTTLGISMGTGGAAHAGQRIMDVDAPGFRTGTAVGAIIAALLVIGFWIMMSNRRRRKKQLEGLKAEVRDREDRLWEHELQAKRQSGGSETTQTETGDTR